MGGRISRKFSVTFINTWKTWLTSGTGHAFYPPYMHVIHLIRKAGIDKKFSWNSPKKVHSPSLNSLLSTLVSVSITSKGGTQYVCIYFFHGQNYLFDVVYYRGAQYRYFVIDSISIILFPFLSIPISMSVNIKRAYQYQCVINYWKVPLSISISMSINWLPYQYQYQYFNSYQNLLKSVPVDNLCIIKQGSTAEIVRQR